MTAPIVVGVDGSPESEQALAYAISLSRAMEAALVVLAVAEAPLAPESSVTGEFLDPVPVDLLPAAPAEIEDLLVKVSAELEPTGIAWDSVWVVGDPAAELVRIAEARGARSIVLGRSSAGPRAGLFGEDVAAEVERQSPCEIIVVPPAE
jgi:nucleotide-binding universal stress UspA family protein